MAKDVAGLLIPAQWGDERFACECGARFEDGGAAILHTFAGHETAVERFAGGRWRFKTRRVADLIVERLREKGEDVGAFVRRMQAAADAAEQRAGDPETHLWVGPGVMN